MTVKTAKESIKDINEIMEKIELLLKKDVALYAKSGFLTDAVAYLGDYKRMLEKAIDMSKLPI